MQRSLKSEVTGETIVDEKENGESSKKVNVLVRWESEKVDSANSDSNISNANNNDHGADNGNVIEPSERLSVMRQQFAVGATGTGSSSIEDRRFCCTNMALMVYKKAWEGARKALPRATKNRNKDNNNLDNNSSSIDQQRRAIATLDNQDPNRTISLESEDDLATECSFEYEEEGVDLPSELGDQSSSSSPLRRKRPGKEGNDRPTTLRGLERLSTEGSEDFGEEESNSGPEDVDLEAFKRVYMSDFVIPEEPDKESAAVQQETQLKGKSENINNNNNSKKEESTTTTTTTNSEGSKWRRRFKLDEKLKTSDNQDISSDTIEQNNKNSEETSKDQSEEKDSTTGSDENNRQIIGEPDKSMSLTDIERFVQSTCDQVMAKVQNEGEIDTEEDASIRGSGVFKIRSGIRTEESIGSRASTGVTMSTIEIPTITITEDQLDDSSVIISETTLNDDTGSEGLHLGDGGSSQGAMKDKTGALKFKVKRLGSKVKDIFKKGTTPEVSPTPSPVGEYIDIEEEKRRRRDEEKEAERKRKEEEKEAERKRKEEEAARKEEEKALKEEAEKKRKDEEFERKYMEMVRKAEADAAKEEARRRKEYEKRLAELEEKRRREEEKLRKEEAEKKRKDEEFERKYMEMVRHAEAEAAKEEAKREEKRRKEEEKRRKMREEEEKRRLKGLEEERRKLREAEEKRKKLAAEEERRRKQIEEEEEEERRRRQKQEEENERRRKEEERRLEEERRREEKEAEERRKDEENNQKLREILKLKLEDEMIISECVDGDDPDVEEIKQYDEDNNNEIIKTKQDDHPYYTVEGVHDEQRHASSPSLASGHASVTVSKSTSQATIMIPSPPSNRDKRSPSRDEETFGQAGESEGDLEPQMDGRKRKKMRKRLRDTKNKLINLKSKALESLPSMSSLKSRVKEILPVRSGTSGQDEGGQIQNGEIDQSYSIHREQKIFSEYRKRYPDSENEFFSDSELVESRKSTLKAITPDLEQVPGGMYENIETSTEDRVQLLLSPINSPLRPPRRSDYGAGNHAPFHTSEPNISRTGTPKKPKRAPPPRPPPPEVETYLDGSSQQLNLSREGSTTASLGAYEDIDLNSSNRDLSSSISVKKEIEKIPASIYYRNVVRDWQERYLKRLDELISASSPNLEKYQRPPRPGTHPPRVYPLSSSTKDIKNRPRPIPRRRSSRASILRQKIYDQKQTEELFIGKENVDGYEVLERRVNHQLTTHPGLPPLPPPRLRSDRQIPPSKSFGNLVYRRQQQQKQQEQLQQRLVQQDYLLSVDRANLATDGLYWKPFSWKTGRCRSLTELYVRKRSQPPIIIDSKPSEAGSENSLSQEPIERSLSYRLMSQYCSPPRPPPPTIIKTEPSIDLDVFNSEGQPSEPIYSTIDRSKKLKRELISDDNITTSTGEVIIQSRPLPAPPLPPRSKRKNSFSRSRSNSPYLSLTNSSVDLNRPETTFIRPVSPYPSVGMVDVSVETSGSQSIYPCSLESKECQTSLEDLAIKPTTEAPKPNDNNNFLRSSIQEIKQSDNELDYFDDGRESITPTPTNTVKQVEIKVTPEREVFTSEDFRQNDLTLNSQLKRTRLSSSSSKDSSPPLVTASSGSFSARSKISPLRSGDDERTLTNYFDAEECDTDMDTFTDLDSFSTDVTQTLTASSQFHSVLSEPPTFAMTATATTTSRNDTNQDISSNSAEIPTPPKDPAPSPPSSSKANEASAIEDSPTITASSPSSMAVPLVAEHVTIEEDSDDDMLQPRVASPSEMRAYMSRRRMRPDSMDGSDPEW